MADLCSLNHWRTGRKWTRKSCSKRLGATSDLANEGSRKKRFRRLRDDLIGWLQREQTRDRRREEKEDSG